MAKSNKKFGIVISSCESYDDALQNFFFLLDVHNIRIEKIFNVFVVSDFNHDLPDYVNLLVSTEQDWQKRLNNLISKTDLSHFLFLLDDYYIGEYFSPEELNEYFIKVSESNINYLRLINIPMIQGDNDILCLDNLQIKHAVNLQAAIWEKNFFLSICQEGSPWSLEVVLDNNEINNCFTTTYDFLNIKNGILQGKIIRESLHYFVKNDIKLPYQNRPLLGYYSTILRCFKNYFNRYIKNRKFRKILKKFLSIFGLKFVTED